MADPQSLVPSLVPPTQPVAVPGLQSDVSVVSQGAPTLLGSAWPQFLAQNITSPSYDTFGRIRVSEPFTLFNTVHQYDANPLYWDTIAVGAGAIASLHNDSAVQLSTSAANGDSIKFQTHNYMRYQPGKSQLIMLTAVLGPKTANVVRRAGFYDDNNGMFFEVTGSDMAVVRRTSTSGSPVDNRISQAQWNRDTLDGSHSAANPSGFALDPSKMELMFIDFEWLGTGVVRWGFQLNGQTIVCHIDYHANILNIPYTTTVNLPVRYELTNTGAAAGANTLLSVCSTVMTEGGQQQEGTPFGISTGTVTKAVAGPLIPILSIRPALTFNGIVNRALVNMAEMSIMGDAPLSFDIWLNGALTNAAFAAVDANSVVQFDTGATAIVGGTHLFSGLLSVSGTGNNKSGINTEQLMLGRKLLSLNAAGNAGDILTITASKIASNATAVSANFNWVEYR